MDARTTARLHELLSRPINWEAVLHAAARHRVRPLLYAALAKAESGAVPSAVLSELREFAAENSRKSLFMIAQLFKLLDLLQSHGIPAAPFKGPVLSSLAYGSLALREVGDLDLLIRKSDMASVKRLLVSRGFRPAFPTARPDEVAYVEHLTGSDELHYLASHEEHHFVNPRTTVNIDVHWALTLRGFWVQLRPNEVWWWLRSNPATDMNSSDARFEACRKAGFPGIRPVSSTALQSGASTTNPPLRRQPLAGRALPGFGVEQTLLVLCLNGAKDCWRRLDRICDVAELLQSHHQMNWQWIFQTAKRLGIRRMVCLGLALAADLLDARVPEPAVKMIAADPKIGPLVKHVRERLFAGDGSGVETLSGAMILFHLRLRERLSDRIGYCLARLEPTLGDWAAFPIPRRLALLQYFARPVRLLIRFCRSRLRSFER